jgi:hypothetical protein
VVPYSTWESAAIAVTHVIFAVFAVLVALTALIHVCAHEFALPAASASSRTARIMFRNPSRWEM